MKIRAIAAAAAALYLVFSGASHAKPAEVPIGQDFEGFAFSVTSSGQIIIFAGARDIGGKVAICGVVFFEDATATTRSLERQFTEKVGFSLAGKPIPVSTGVFKRYKSVEEAKAGGTARCSTSNRPWNPAYAKTPVVMTLGPTTAFQ